MGFCSYVWERGGGGLMGCGIIHFKCFSVITLKSLSSWAGDACP